MLRREFLRLASATALRGRSAQRHKIRMRPRGRRREDKKPPFSSAYKKFAKLGHSQKSDELSIGPTQ